ncbi:MAG: hypothetical protein ACYCPS_02445 [Candidatus Saccharimonadales bacterium]
MFILANIYTANVIGDYVQVVHPYLTNVRGKWYRHGIKHIPDKFSLIPLMLAIWLMDDDCKHGKSADFSVHNFSNKAISRLRDSLRKLGGLTTVNFDWKGHRIYIRCIKL